MKRNLLLLIILLATNINIIGQTSNKVWFEPDTIISYYKNGNRNRECYVFDKNGKQLVLTRQIWKENDWVNNYRYISTYDEDGNLAIELCQYWIKNSWADSQQNIFTYDKNGKQLTFLNYDWNNGDWVISWESVYTRNEDGNPLTFNQTYHAPSETIEWRDVWTYDENGRKETSGSLIQNGINWENYRRYIYTYDENGNEKDCHYQQWTGNDWAHINKKSRTYNKNEQLSSIICQNWDEETWENNEKITYAYDSNNNLLTSTSESWRIDSWINENTHTYDYNDEGNLLTHHIEFFSNGHSEYKYLSTYSYDKNGNTLAAYGQILTKDEEMNEDAPYPFKLRYKSQWGDVKYDITGYKFEVVSYVRFGESEEPAPPTIYSIINTDRIHIYPNPTVDILTIDTASPVINLTLFDTYGKAIVHTCGSNQLDLSVQPTGVYLLKVKTTEGESIQKIIKR